MIKLDRQDDEEFPKDHDTAIIDQVYKKSSWMLLVSHKGFSILLPLFYTQFKQEVEDRDYGNFSGMLSGQILTILCQYTNQNMDKDPMEEQARLHKEVADLVEELGEEDDRERRKDLKKRCLNSLSGLARPHDGRRARCLSIISEQGEHHVSLKAPWSPSHGQDIKHPAPSPKLTPTKLHSANKSDPSHRKPSNQLKIEKHESIVQDFGPLAALGGMSDEQLEEFLQEKERFERMAIEQGKGKK